MPRTFWYPTARLSCGAACRTRVPQNESQSSRERNELEHACTVHVCVSGSWGQGTYRQQSVETLTMTLPGCGADPGRHVGYIPETGSANGLQSCHERDSNMTYTGTGVHTHNLRNRTVTSCLPTARRGHSHADLGLIVGFGIYWAEHLACTALARRTCILKRRARAFPCGVHR
eukprot:91993-Chlamydomonas_euryale.AAC.6